MYGQQASLQTIKVPKIWAGGQLGSPQVKLYLKGYRGQSTQDETLHTWNESPGHCQALGWAGHAVHSIEGI